MVHGRAAASGQAAAPAPAPAALVLISLLPLYASQASGPHPVRGGPSGDPGPSCAEFRGLRLLKCMGFEPAHVLDLGANRGTWTREHLEVFQAARFVLLDGTAYWRWWRALFGTGQVNGTVAVLGSEQRQVPWYASRVFKTGNSVFKETTHFFAGIAAKRRFSHRLDNLLAARRWPLHFELVKMDLQGAELDVLRGAPTVLAHAQVLLLELPFAAVYNAGAPSFADYVAFLDGAGFVPFDITEEHRGAGLLAQVDFVFVRRGSTWAKAAQSMIRGAGRCGSPGSLAKPWCVD